MGFLLDFRAATNEPEPEEPETKAAPVVPGSRFAHAPGSHSSVTDGPLEPAAPLPVWPPVPGADAALPPEDATWTTAETLSAPPPAAPPAAAPVPSISGPAPADERRGVSVFRRIGRRS